MSVLLAVWFVIEFLILSRAKLYLKSNDHAKLKFCLNASVWWLLFILLSILFGWA